jgi:anaerobic nitric oxide reductase transcription regulator
VPPLRERLSDIPVLAGYFCEQIQRKLGLKPVRLSPDAFEALSSYNWPGNVRELENMVSRGALKASSRTSLGSQIVLKPGDLVADLGSGQISGSEQKYQKPIESGGEISLTDMTKNFQRQVIRHALDENEGNWAAAARSLKMHRSNLHNLATRLGLRHKVMD